MTKHESGWCLETVGDSYDEFCIVETRDGFGILQIRYEDGWGKCFLWENAHDFVEKNGKEK